MNKTRFTTKVLLSLLVVIVVLGSVVTVASAADTFANYKLAYGEIVPTDEKLEAQKFTYSLYGDSDDIYFMRISTGKPNAFFAVEIYADSNYQEQIRSYSKGYDSTPGNKSLKVTWEFKTLPSGTYYGRCYTFIESDGNRKIDSSSMKTFTINVDRISKKTVTLKSLTNTASGPKITWTPFSTATKYNVYRRAAGEKSWTRIATLGANASTYTDKTAKSGTVYTYTVKCYEGKLVSLYNKTGLSIKYLATPAVSVNGSGASGVAKLSWKAIPGAEGYYVYRKGGSLSDYSWVRIATIKNGKTISYTDKAATSTDWKYTYTVKAYSGKTISAYNKVGVDFDYIPAPNLTKTSSVYGGVKIDWKSSNPNVIKYNVYRKNGTSWKLLGSTTEKTFIDKTAVSGKSYIYTVKALSDTNAGAYKASGITAKYMATPELNTLTFDSKDRSLVKWNAVDGAAGYRVYRKINNAKSWSMITIIKNGKTTKYYDPCEKTSGYTYSYTVRAFDSKNNFSFFVTKGTSAIYLEKPVFTAQQIVSAENPLCVEVKWNAVDGATKYNVYRRLPGESWTVLAKSTTELTFLDTTAECGITYDYAVRAFNDNGHSSHYNTATVMPLLIPELNSVMLTETGCALTWDALDNATSYTIYRRAENSDVWEIAGTSETTEFTDISEECKTQRFYYTVSATFGETESQYGNGLPNFVEIEITATLVDAIDDAPAYINVEINCPEAQTIEVYKNANDEEPVLLEGVTGTFTDNGITDGNTYTYTVIAFAEGKVAGEKSAAAKYPHPPLNATVITQCGGDYNNNEPTVTLSWDTIEFADAYIILRSNSNNEWSEIVTVAAQDGVLSYTYTDTDVLTEITYNYKVKAVATSSERDASESDIATVFIPTPLGSVTGLKIENPEKTQDGKVCVTVSWAPTEYATSYQLFRKTADTDWELLYVDSDEADGLQYIDYVDVNVEYTYRVDATAPDRGTVTNQETFFYKEDVIPEEPVAPEEPEIDYVILNDTEDSVADGIITTNTVGCDDFSVIAVAIEGYTLDAVKQGEYYGTGSAINVYKDGENVKTYTLVVKADVNGDGVCDVLDYTALSNYINEHTELDSYAISAADLNNDGIADTSDLDALNLKIS
ncbi:MAG: hypothetical protein IJ025_00065 [Clostridia bacterium]|nr:hypothetical protein [Clostridia bacterium]